MKFLMEPMGRKNGLALNKCYYRNGENYGEFYFNVNLEIGLGEIIFKDPSYSKVLIAAFAKEMNGQMFPRCTRCNEAIVGEEDSVCGNCTGEQRLTLRFM